MSRSAPARRFCVLARPCRRLFPGSLIAALFLCACQDSSRAAPGDEAGLDAGAEHDTGSSAPHDARAAAHDAEPDASGSRGDASLVVDASAMPEAGSALVTRSFVGAAGETWEGTGSFAVDVALSRPATEAVHVKLALSGTASAPTDYRLAQTELEIPAGSSSGRVSISVVDDHEIEASETLILSIVDASPAATYTLRIADDDDERWPSDDAVSEVDAARAFAGVNLSGLVYQPARGAVMPVLWLVRNGPSQLYRLVPNAALWSSTATEGWAQGKTLLFPGGSGAPDAESVTMADWSSPMLYVASERDGIGPSAPTVLAYDTSAAGATLTAVRAWDLTRDLASLALDANAGPEALTWVPDSYLVSAGFFDEASAKPYDPGLYPNHGAGVFFLGIEQNGRIYAYVLDQQSAAYTRVATIESGHPGLMALEFDRDVGYLWAWCDDTCGNQATILRVEDNAASTRKGHFTLRRRLKRPASLPNVNNEGMALAPASTCAAGKKAVFWVEDGTADHMLRRGTIPCGPFLSE